MVLIVKQERLVSYTGSGVNKMTNNEENSQNMARNKKKKRRKKYQGRSTTTTHRLQSTHHRTYTNGAIRHTNMRNTRRLKLTHRTKQYSSGAFNYIMKVLDTGSVALNFIF